jgi:hypothetical protein
MTTHGMTGSPEYRTWKCIKNRCHSASGRKLKYYGGRGVSVCDRWRYSFENFLADMGRKPSPAHSIDRVDPNGHYEPGNCRWANPIEQRYSRRDGLE